jgi:hypothetical protein
MSAATIRPLGIDRRASVTRRSSLATPRRSTSARKRTTGSFDSTSRATPGSTTVTTLIEPAP